MRAGFVARIRLNPKDCLSVLDVVEGAGINVEGMSFSAITSLAMACMLEALRKANTIPTNDGFNYERRMQVYIGGKSNYDKRVLTEALYVGAARGLQLPPIKPEGDRAAGNSTGIHIRNPEHRARLLEEYKELDEIFTQHTKEQRARYKELEQAFLT